VTQPTTEWELLPEEEKVIRMRYRLAELGGLTADEAMEFALGDQPTWVMRRLVDAGCPARLIRKIAL
jgi:hypothetical protein